MPAASSRRPTRSRHWSAIGTARSPACCVSASFRLSVPIFCLSAQADCTRRFPDLRLVLREDLTDNLIDALEKVYTLDVLLIALPEQGGVTGPMPLFREPFCFACPTGHTLANRPVVTERELAHERLLLLTMVIACATALAVCSDRPRPRGHERRLPRYQPGDDLRDGCRGDRLYFAAGDGGATPDRTTSAAGGATAQAARAYRRIGLLWRASFPRGEDLEVFGRFIQDQLPDSVDTIDLSLTARPPRRGGSVSRARSDVG